MVSVLTRGLMAVEVGAKEPWPNDVKLFEPNHAWQMLLPDHANCLAVEAFLKMCKLDYSVEQHSNAEFMVSCGKVPFIKCGAHVVAGLESIVSFVGNKGIHLTSDLSTQEKGDMRAYMSLITNVLANAELYLTWCDPVTYKEVTKPRYASVFPWPLGPVLCWQKRNAVVKRLSILAWANKSLEEVYSEVDKCFQSLSVRLGDKNFFFGEKYNELDATVYGHLFNILTTPLPHPNDMLPTLVHEYPALVHFCKTIEKKYFIDSNSVWMGPTHAHEPFTPFTYFQRPIAVLQPTELDALVFGHVFSILSTPLPNDTLGATVHKYEAVINLCKRIETYYENDESDNFN